MNHTVKIIPDKRFKPGNFKVTRGAVRSNPESVKLKPLYGNPAYPGPMVVSRELAKALKRAWS